MGARRRCAERAAALSRSVSGVLPCSDLLSYAKADKRRRGMERLRCVRGRCASMAPRPTLRVIAHGTDIAPDGERDDEARRSGQARCEHQRGAGQCVGLRLGASLQERHRSRHPQVTESEHRKRPISDRPFGAREVAELWPSTDRPNGLEPHAIAALEQGCRWMSREKRIECPVVLPCGNEPDTARLRHRHQFSTERRESSHLNVTQARHLGHARRPKKQAKRGEGSHVGQMNGGYHQVYCTVA